jgi:hypothetical protein
MKLKQRQVGIAIAGMAGAIFVCILVITLVARSFVPNPEFRGKRVSAWFDQLCSGVFSGTRKGESFPEAYDAFLQMGPEAVPYLTRELSRDRSGSIEKVLLWLRQKPITQPLMRNTILPSSSRTYAAVALRQLGGRAEAAIPALLEAWKRDIPDVKINCFSAMAAILFPERKELRSGIDLDQASYLRFEAGVISHATKRFPEIANTLRIKAEPTPRSAEPEDAANGSQPARAETITTPAADDSRR